MIVQSNLLTTMKTNRSQKEMIRSYNKVGDQVNPSMRIHKIGTKYVTCISIMDGVHFVRYTFGEFIDNFMNR